MNVKEKISFVSICVIIMLSLVAIGGVFGIEYEKKISNKTIGECSTMKNFLVEEPKIYLNNKYNYYYRSENERTSRKF